MDDHMYDNLLDYAKCDLIPRFKNEYKVNSVMSECASYEEVQVFCKALNMIGNWLGYEKMTPKRIIEFY